MDPLLDICLSYVSSTLLLVASSLTALGIINFIAPFRLVVVVPFRIGIVVMSIVLFAPPRVPRGPSGALGSKLRLVVLLFIIGLKNLTVAAGTYTSGRSPL